VTVDPFRKHRSGAPAGFFEAEAAGLRWLAVPGGVPVTDVLDVGPDHITIARVRETVPTRDAARRFGEQLVATHDAGASAFGVGPDGWAGDGFIGEAPLTLRAHARWGEFYTQERVLPYAQRAGLGTGLRSVGALAERVASGEFDDDAPPARIHGDLWSGNVLFNGRSATLIDPAAHGGHRITDLAMLALFGLPHLDEVYSGYESATTHLPDGWRDLIGLHQLHPLLVHAVLFGGGYAARAAALAHRY
jgi:fructosamine-3-kinase